MFNYPVNATSKRQHVGRVLSTNHVFGGCKVLPESNFVCMSANLPLMSKPPFFGDLSIAPIAVAIFLPRVFLICSIYTAPLFVLLCESQRCPACNHNHQLAYVNMKIKLYLKDSLTLHNGKYPGQRLQSDMSTLFGGSPSPRI